MPFLFNDDKSRADLNAALAPTLNQLESAYQNNINSVYQTLVNSGSTPADKTPTSINNAIDYIVTQIYQLGSTPASKMLNDLKAAITALTTKTWTFNYNASSTNVLDCRNIKQLTIVSSVAMTITLTYYTKSGSAISSEIISIGGSATFPSNANYVDIIGIPSQNIDFAVTYQTKVLRGTD